jgi:C-terminal processing protease CtpA/Prc
VPLRQALAFLERPEVRDLAQGSPDLRSRHPNVWADLAVMATRRGDTLAALSALEKVYLTGGTSANLQVLRSDTTLRRWANHPRFERVVSQFRQQGRQWADSAFITPYRDTLPFAERVAGLSLVWAEIRYAFPDFGYRPELDWDSLYIAYVPRVQGTPSTFEYYRVLQRFVAELGDSHTNVYFPPAINRGRARPPIRTALVEERVLITEIQSRSLAGAGLHVGDEIIDIDGVPIRQYADSLVAPYEAAATPQDKRIRVYTYSLLIGSSSTPVRLGIRRADGSKANIVIQRSGYTDLVPARPPVTDTILKGDIGYLRISTFALDSVGVWIEQAMSRLMGTKSLIIDIRENGGGNTTLGLLDRLARDTTSTIAQRVRNYSALDRAQGIEPQSYELGYEGFIQPRGAHYDGSVALLVGPRTFSAGEDFAAAFAEMHRGTTIGEPTGGNTGQPMIFPLPGGGTGRVRTKHDYYADGSEFLFVGIQPQLVVRPSIAGVRAGRDEVLEAAITLVRRER